ncbi:MAG TPA: hypothetical protein VKB08_10925, partial [Bradyrhizobium sp.]|nr:hypothetical protein [Bradyrhizobium sp.]
TWSNYFPTNRQLGRAGSKDTYILPNGSYTEIEVFETIRGVILAVHPSCGTRIVGPAVAPAMRLYLMSSKAKT